MSPSGLFNHLSAFFRPLQSVALFDPSGLNLLTKAQRAEDFGTLVSSVQTVQRYLNLSAGQVAVLNDPYSGGSHLYCFYLVCKFSHESVKSSMGTFTLVKKINTKPRVKVTHHIDEEGLRIPPTPIGSFDCINEELLQAISSHPLAPTDFSIILLQEVQRLEREIGTLRQILRLHLGTSSSLPLKGFHRYFNEGVSRIFDQVADGIAEGAWPIGNETALQLRIESQTKNMTFDFSGTGRHRRGGLTDSACLGVCMAAFLRSVNQPPLATQALYDRFILIAPKQSFVNESFPSPVFQGMTDGAAYLYLFIEEILQRFKGKVPLHAMSGFSQCSFELEFENETFFDHVLPGSGGSSQKSGEVATAQWGLYQLQPSVEEIEQRYPIEVLNLSVRKRSGGTGLHPGGNGLIKTIRLLKPAQFSWMISQYGQKISGIEGGRAGAPAEVFVIHPNGKKELQALEGSLSLKPATIVSIHSSGGGGWGHPDSEEIQED